MSDHVRDASTNLPGAAEVQGFFVRLREGPLDRGKKNDPDDRGPERREGYDRKSA